MEDKSTEITKKLQIWTCY